MTLAPKLSRSRGMSVGLRQVLSSMQSAKICRSAWDTRPAGDIVGNMVEKRRLPPRWRAGFHGRAGSVLPHGSQLAVDPSEVAPSKFDPGGYLSAWCSIMSYWPQAHDRLWQPRWLPFQIAKWRAARGAVPEPARVGGRNQCHTPPPRLSLSLNRRTAW
jgi:hypothetical protein